MAESPLSNGDRYVTRYEWADRMKQSDKLHQEHNERIDRLESKWDRWAGPAVFLLVLIGALASVASVATFLLVATGGGAA